MTCTAPLLSSETCHQPTAIWIEGDVRTKSHTFSGGIHVGGTFRGDTQATVSLSGYAGGGIIGRYNDHGIVTSPFLPDSVFGADSISQSSFPTPAGKSVVVKTTALTSINQGTLFGAVQDYQGNNLRVVIGTAASIRVTRDSYGRNAGFSLFAPHSDVTFDANLGFLDGWIVAKTITHTGQNAGQLQNHGTGPEICITSASAGIVCPAEWGQPSLPRLLWSEVIILTHARAHRHTPELQAVDGS